MARVKFINHKDKKILHVDLSNCSVEHALRIIEEGKKIIRAQSKHSILALTNFNNENAFVPDLFQAMKEYAQHNKPYIKASAVVVYRDMHKLFIETMAHLTNREFGIFDDTEKAKDWLAEA